MSSKYLTGIYSVGYLTHLPFDNFTLAGLGYIGGYGLIARTAYTVLDNLGDIEGHNANAGVEFDSGMELVRRFVGAMRWEG